MPGGNTGLSFKLKLHKIGRKTGVVKREVATKGMCWVYRPGMGAARQGQPARLKQLGRVVGARMGWVVVGGRAARRMLGLAARGSF